MPKRFFGLMMAVMLLISSCDVIQLESRSKPDDPVIYDEEPAQTDNDAEKSADATDSLVEPEFEDDVDESDPSISFPKETQAINPLTGLPVSNPDNLLLPPALVSVTNFPPTARPQAGLSYSPIVFELYIGDGMTRYLAIFYGDYPHQASVITSQDLEEELTAGMDAPMIGPVRSGRIPYEHIRKLYNGFIIMASAYSRVADQLNDFVNVFGSDQSDVNSAMVGVEDIEAIAKDNEDELGDAALGGMEFSEDAPEGGKDAPSLWLYYAFKNQVFWRFNASDGTYHRWQDNADGETFIEQTDRLTGEPLGFENVVVLLVDHTVEQKYFIDLDLLYVEREKALVFRDGKVHEIYWTTKSEEYEQTTGKLRPIRFIDAEGNPFPLKPGQTWIELIPTHSPIWETVDSEKYHLLLNGRSKGSGYWAVWFAFDN